MRENPAWADTPLIAMLADVTADRAQCLAVGVTDHLIKPVDPRRLYATLARTRPVPA